MSPDEIRPLYEYNAWANRRSLAAAEKLTIRAIHEADGVELPFRPRHSCSYLRRRVDLARAVSGTLSLGVTKRRPILQRTNSA